MKLSRKGLKVLAIGTFFILIPLALFVVWLLVKPDTQVAPDDSSAGDYPPPVFQETCSDLAGPGVVCEEDGAYYCETGEGKTCTYKQKCKCTETYNGNIYYQWIDSGDQCADMSECPAPGGGECTQPECDAAGNGPGAGTGTTSGIYCFCDSFQCSTVNGSQCSNRCDSNCESFTGVLGCGDDPRPEDERDIPLGCYARQIDYYGGSGGYSLCPRSLFGDDCETPPPPDDDSCSITVAADCKYDSTISNDPLDDGVSADITWNVSNATFDFGPTSGKVVLRINDLANGWFTEGFDTWWATNYQEFITAGGNAAGDTWNFDIRTNAQGVSYDSIKDGENYEVWATAYTTPTSETGICESTKVTFKCESTDTEPLCGNGTCDSGERCETGDDGAFSCPIGGPNQPIPSCRANCTYCGDGIRDAGEQCDDGNNNNGDGCNASCQTEIITTDPYCGDGVCNQSTEACEGDTSCIVSRTLNDPPVECRANCTYCGDGILNGNEQCDDGNEIDGDECGNNCSLPNCGDGNVDPGEQCDDGNTNDDDECTNNCRLPLEADWEVTKTGTPTCVTGKDHGAEIFYKITVMNNGVGSTDMVIDTLDPKIDTSWIDPASIVPTGVVGNGKITWATLSGSREFQSGETREFVYKVNIPSTAYGTFTNTVEVLSGSAEPISATNETTVSCDGAPLPDTAIFDNILGRVGVGLVLISISGLYFYMDGTDRVLLRYLSKKERVGYERERFERMAKKIERSSLDS